MGRFIFNRQWSVIPGFLWAAFLLPLLWAPIVPAAQGDINLKVGVMPIDSCTQIFVAYEKGFFSKRGLQVTLTAMQGGVAIASAVSSGALNVGWSNTAALIIAATKGFDFQYIAPGALFLSSNPPNLLLTRADSPIRTAKELEGQAVGVPELGSMAEIMVRQWVKRAGANPNALRLVEIPFPQVEPALKSDRVKAAITAEPFLTAALEKKTARVLANAAGAISPRFVVGSTVARKSWISAHREEAKRYLEAIKEATVYINAHPQERANILPKHTRLTPDLVQKITPYGFETSLKRADIQPMIDASLEHGLISAPVNIRDLVAETVPLE